MGDVNEHDWRVIFPATNSNDANELVTSESREFALADELLHAYVVATPRAEADPLEIRALDIQISARVMADGEAAASLSSSKTALATTWTSVRTEKDATKNQLKTNYAAALFSYSLVLGAPENEPIIHSQSRAVLFPVRIPLSLTTLRAIPANPRLDISVTIQPRHLQNLHQGIDFDSPNLLDGLSDDPYFNPNALPVHSLPFQLKRQSVANLFQVPLIVNKSIPLLSCFALTLRAFEASSTTVILRASLINLVPVSEACSVKVMSLVPEIPGQTIKSICAGAFPAELLAGDEACFVFNALKLSNGSNHFAEPESDQKQQVRQSFLSLSIQWTSSLPGLLNQNVRSKWICPFDELHKGTSLTAVPKEPIVPKSLGLSSYELAVGPLNPVNHTVFGLEISFRVMPPLQVKKVFTVEMIIINMSSRARNLLVSVPGKRIPTLHEQKESMLTKLHVTSEVFLSQYMQLENQDGELFCLENNFMIREMIVGSCQSIHLHFIALRGNLHSIEAIEIDDLDESQKITLKDILQIVMQ